MRKPPDRVKKYTLLHVTASLSDWAHWLDAHGATGIDAKKDLIFDLRSAAFGVAGGSRGLGVAMAAKTWSKSDEPDIGQFHSAFDIRMAHEDLLDEG